MSRRLMLRDEPGGGGVLPPEYQQVEWIGSSGTEAYVPTGIIPSTSMCFSFDFMVDSFSASNGSARICNVVNASSGMIRFVQQVRTTYGLYFYGGGGTPMSTSRQVLEGEWLTARIEPSGYRRAVFTLTDSGGVQLSSGVVKGDTSSMGVNAQMIYLGFAGKVKRFQSWYSDGGDIAHHVPCYRKSDGGIGMYDTVHQTFYTNAGKGAFTKGADV